MIKVNDRVSIKFIPSLVNYKVLAIEDDTNDNSVAIVSNGHGSFGIYTHALDKLP